MNRSRITLAGLLLAALVSAAADAQVAKGLNDLGVMAFQAKRYEEALEHLEKARKVAPENPAIRRNLCAVHQAMAGELAEAGNFDAAIARIGQAIEVDPDNPAPLAQLGAYHLRAGNVAEATGHLEKAVQLAPDNGEARALLGEAYYQQNKLEAAREQWEQVEDTEVDFPGLQEKLAKLDRESSVEADFNRYTAGHFQLSYAEALSEDMRATIFEILESAYESVGQRLGGRYPPDTVQVVLYDGEQFEEATGSAAHVGALYDGKIRAPITSKTGRFLTRRMLSARLTHEYVHVVLTGDLGNAVPWWFNEGLAEVFSREMDRSRERMLGRAHRGERTHALASLETSQLERLQKEDLAVAYAQAHATVQYLWETGGADKLQQFVRRLDGGATAEEALKAAYGMDYAALEQAVAATHE